MDNAFIKWAAIGFIAVEAGLIFLDALAHWRGRPFGEWFPRLLTAVVGGALLSHMLYFFGEPGTGIYLLLGFGIPYLAEAAGLKLGLGSRRYEYIGMPGPKLPLGVPFYVAMAWGSLLYGCINLPLAAAFSMIESGSLTIATATIATATVTALMMVGIDLICDPISVELGLWKWNGGGRWYGIPYQNFVFWLATSWITTAAVAAPLLGAFGGAARMPSPGDAGFLWLALTPTGMIGLAGIHLATRAKLLNFPVLSMMGLLQGSALFLFYLLLAFTNLIPI